MSFTPPNSASRRSIKDVPALSRRQFVRGLAAGGALLGLGAWPRQNWALATGHHDQHDHQAHHGAAVNTRFHLHVGETLVNYTGKVRPAVTLNGSLPGPLLRWQEGTRVQLQVHNDLPEGSIHGDTTSIHWHGIVLPANMDGVPGLSFEGIARGKSYLYEFDVRQSGTYWYHSHSGFQEQGGLYGPLIIDPIEPPPFRYDRDYVVFLSDWTDMDPSTLFDRLKKQPAYDNYSQRTVGDFLRDVRHHGLGDTLRERVAWGQMRMPPTDLSDVSANTYTYLLNGTTSLGNWTGLFRHGEKIRLRLINGSAMTYFDLRIPGVKMTVVAVDGQYVQPLTVDELRLAAAETFDVIVEPSGADAFTIFAQDSARTGYVNGTLAVREGLRAPVPELDARPLLSMADMGHGDHGNHNNHGARAGHSAHSAHTNHGALSSPAAQTHPDTETNNPLVDMRTDWPQPRLDDPGIGLRDNDRQVATYAELKSLFPDPDGREPGRTIELHLTGHMERFSWSFNGVRFNDAEPLRLKYGERVRIVLVNDTMMSHPIHLHGLWSDLEDEHGNFQVRKHTINMPPGTKRSYRVTADALGRWAYHCHLFYHMEAGMFREVRVEE